MFYYPHYYLSAASSSAFFFVPRYLLFLVLRSQTNYSFFFEYHRVAAEQGIRLLTTTQADAEENEFSVELIA